MDKSIDRRIKMTGLYDNIIRVPGYDGEKLEQYGDINLSGRFKMNNGEIGCSLSHIKAITTAFNNGDKHALIMEDDIYNSFEYLWKEKLQFIISKIPRGVECIQFHCINPTIIKQLLKVKEMFTKRDKFSWGTGCYYITRNGMKKVVKKYIKKGIINLSTSSKNKADCKLIYDMLHTVSYTKPLFDHQIGESTIHPSHLETMHYDALCVVCEYFTHLKCRLIIF